MPRRNANHKKGRWTIPRGGGMGKRNRGAGHGQDLTWAERMAKELEEMRMADNG